MSDSEIIVRGARENNLRDVHVVLPRNRLIVFTGVSGSGKSSLAFNTIFAEGQRRYIRSLSTYARQFLGQLEKPDVDFIGGLSPSISIEQKSATRNPRSTVGTVTEIYDYLRVFYARIGTAHCTQCDRPIGAQTREQVLVRILNLPAKSRVYILAPMARAQKGEYRDLFSDMRKQGYVRARVDGQMVEMTEDLQLERQMRHDVDIVMDRLVMKKGIRSRLAEAVDQALELGKGRFVVASDDFDDLLLSTAYACEPCGLSFEEPSPQLLSFNSPQGMCMTCLGLGTKIDFVPELMIVDPDQSILEGAFHKEIFRRNRWLVHLYEGVARYLEFDLHHPWNALSSKQQKAFLYGTGDLHIDYIWRGSHYGGKFEGVIPMQMRRYGQVGERKRRKMEAFMRMICCPDCKAQRLRSEGRAVKIDGLNLSDVTTLTVEDALKFFNQLKLSNAQLIIGEEALKEIKGRLGFLMNVGLHYLTLDRSAPSLSGGEAQRIRMASQIGSGLVGVTYILDEPSIGLHPKDNSKLLNTLQLLRDQGNTVVVVEHDEETMRFADHIVDFGPGPGVLGGHVVTAGNFEKVMQAADSLTGDYLSGRKWIPIPEKRRSVGRKGWLTVTDAAHNNLKKIKVRIPLQAFTVVTGVSGSGKSSFVNDILWEALARDVNGAKTFPGAYKSIRGFDKLQKVINIDQSPIGRTPRSNPATYVGVMDPIRSLFASLPESKVRGYLKGRFSFNVKGGRCEACEGRGANRLEMDFLADIWVACPICNKKRFNRETLVVRYKGKNIADVLNLDIQEALVHFKNIPNIRSMLEIMNDVGLGYLKLGQSSTTLSGGEAQRIKLAEQLVRPSRGEVLYILDEPTTGLHFADVEKLLNVLHRFVEAGHTVLVVEHHLDIIKNADHIIDLGPEGGAEGGEVVATGTPEQIAQSKESYTGAELAKILNGVPKRMGKNKRHPQGAPHSHPPSPVSHPPSPIKEMVILGANQHNLKNIEVRVPRNKLTVFSGMSGSGKSSLALDTIYAEGQRKYVESLSAYARQFLGQMPKPKVEKITGLSPAIAIEQKAPSKNPRSTVGTVTEIYEYLRILWARLGQPHCHQCGARVRTQTSSQIVDQILEFPSETQIYLLAPIEPRANENYERFFERLNQEGYARIRVDGHVLDLGAEIKIDRRRKHQIQLLLDRLKVHKNMASRLAGSVEGALDLGDGMMVVHRLDTGEDIRFSQFRACQQCGTSFEELSARNFAFNTPLGWCLSCEGLGLQRGAKLSLVIPNTQKSLREGAIVAWGPIKKDPFGKMIAALANHIGFDLDTSFADLNPSHRQTILFGLGEEWVPGPGRIQFQYKGLFPTIDWCTRHSWQFRRTLEYLVADVTCLHCKGARIRPDAAAVRFVGKTLPELCALPIGDIYQWFEGLNLAESEQRIAGELLQEISNRLRFLVDVGLDYVTLDRPAPSLSGGESQRIRLASQIGSGLSGVLYVLDEPTIGLHPRDNRRLLHALEKLKDLGNTLIVVEHDRETLENADFILDFGPEAGVNGGQIIGKGSPKQIRRLKRSLTGQYLSNRLSLDVPTCRRPIGEKCLKILGARHNNLKNIDVRFPLETLTCITGVSGSGKSSLVFETLYNHLVREIHRSRTIAGEHDELQGRHHIDKIISIDQNPIGFSPRSDPATYVGVFDEIRKLFSELTDSRTRGYTAGRFSFNRRGGRCETCTGYGSKLIEMHFLPDVWIECDACHGDRYKPETMEVKFKGKNISKILRMTVAESLEHFKNIPRIRRFLQTLFDVGLGYIQLGQSAPTLSGGEAQRVKLASELARPSTGKTVYLLDEPTTGLHFEDIRKLLAVLNRLVDSGNTVILIEHNLDVIKTADWVIDLGPEGGDAGGYLVAEGTPETLAKCVTSSHTGLLLKEILANSHYTDRKVFDFEAYRKQIYQVKKEEQLHFRSVVPWEKNGRLWHLKDRLTKQGDTPLWDSKVLKSIVDPILADSTFKVDWNDRDEFRIYADGKRMPFIVARSTDRRCALIRIRTRKGHFSLAQLRQQLSLPAFNELQGYPAYGKAPRVRALSGGKTYDEFCITPAVLGDVETPAMSQFISDAKVGYKALVGIS